MLLSTSKRNPIVGDLNKQGLLSWCQQSRAGAVRPVFCPNRTVARRLLAQSDPCCHHQATGPHRSRLNWDKGVAPAHPSFTRKDPRNVYFHLIGQRPKVGAGQQNIGFLQSGQGMACHHSAPVARRGSEGHLALFAMTGP